MSDNNPDPIEALEHDALLVGQLARVVDQMQIGKVAEALQSVEHALNGVAAERRAAREQSLKETRVVETMRTELQLIKQTMVETTRETTEALRRMCEMSAQATEALKRLR